MFEWSECLLGDLIKSPGTAILKHIIHHQHDNNIHNNNEFKKMIKNDNIISVKNGLKNNFVEKEIMLCSVSWLILDF